MERPRLKVLYISRGYTTHDHRFLESFVAAGWSPVHLPLLPERLDTRPLPAGAEVADWADGKVSLATAQDLEMRRAGLIEIMGKLEPDVVLAGPVQSGGFLASLAGAKPLIVMSWGSDMLVDADASDESRRITRSTLNSASAVFGDCRAVREAVRRHSDVPDERIVTFPWGIDLDQFTPGPPRELHARSQLGWEDKDVFISTRSWEPGYAIDILVRAFAIVLHEQPDARLILLGDGSLQGEISGLISSARLEAFVHAPGRVSQKLLPDYFRSADVYVSATLSDGTSISLLEAMACGLGVVVSDSFGNLEWVREGVNGALARPGNPESLARAMLKVADLSRGSNLIREANIAVARSRANWKVNFPRLVQLVEALAGSSSR